MPRQDSLTDQIAYLAVLLDDQEWPELAAWLRGEKPRPSVEGLMAASRVAVAHGCYDADDWIKAQFPEEE